MQLTITICCDLVKVWAFIDKWKTCNIFSPNFPRSNCVLHFAWNLQLCLIYIYTSTYTIFVCNWNFICANCWVYCTNCKIYMKNNVATLLQNVIYVIWMSWLFDLHSIRIFFRSKFFKLRKYNVSYSSWLWISIFQ